MEIVYLVLALLISILLLKKFSNKKQPPSPLALPIIGHLHLLRYPLHRTLASLSYKYGPILFLRFGSLPVLVVSSLSAVEQCFSQNDTIFANRPNLIAGKLLGYNYTNLLWAPYGDHWRNLRRVSAIHIFSANSIQASAYIRNEEIRFLVRKLFRESVGGARKVNLKSVFLRLMYDVLTKLITGTRRFIPEQMFAASSLMNMSDYFPVLEWVGKGLEKKMKKVNEERDGFVQRLIDECRRERASSSLPGMKTAKTGRRRTTVVETFLSLQEAEPEFYSDDIIKGMLMGPHVAKTMDVPKHKMEVKSRAQHMWITYKASLMSWVEITMQTKKTQEVTRALLGLTCQGEIMSQDKK